MMSFNALLSTGGVTIRSKSGNSCFEEIKKLLCTVMFGETELAWYLPWKMDYLRIGSHYFHCSRGQGETFKWCHVLWTSKRLSGEYEEKPGRKANLLVTSNTALDILLLCPFLLPRLCSAVTSSERPVRSSPSQNAHVPLQPLISYLTLYLVVVPGT